MIDTALSLVRQYIDAHLEAPTDYALYVISQATILGNFKCLISATLQFGMLFEATYDSANRKWYMNIFGKIATQEMDAVEE